jgi:broad specificity phosphatase PhoE
MSSLTLVRHTQASFHADHYDQLSSLGERQALLLGEAWVRQRRKLTEVYVGPRSRQRHTAELVAACYQRAGLPFPELVTLPELDEYDLSGILQRLAPELARQDLEFARLFDGQRRGLTGRDRERSFQTMFERLLRHWQTATEVMDGLETWPTFCERVARGIKYMTDQPGQSRRVAAFTSGGFIGVATQRVLGAPDRTALEINWRIRNGAVTEFVYSGERITLDSFNSVAHFEEPELVTYR